MNFICELYLSFFKSSVREIVTVSAMGEGIQELELHSSRRAMELRCRRGIGVWERITNQWMSEWPSGSRNHQRGALWQSLWEAVASSGSTAKPHNASGSLWSVRRSQHAAEVKTGWPHSISHQSCIWWPEKGLQRMQTAASCLHSPCPRSSFWPAVDINHTGKGILGNMVPSLTKLIWHKCLHQLRMERSV